MLSKREPRDERFIGDELASAVATAEKQSASGDLLAAWRQNEQIANTFSGLADTAAIRAKADELGESKAVQTALKRERSSFEDQERMSGRVLAILQSKETSEVSRTQDEVNVAEEVRDLRRRTEEEKQTERAIILKRALAGVFVGAFETGDAAMEQKDYRNAARCFTAAAEARPGAEWPLRQLAIAQALEKDRKTAVETLRRIKPSDLSEFQKWLAAEPAFADLRGQREMKELLGTP